MAIWKKVIPCAILLVSMLSSCELWYTVFPKDDPVNVALSSKGAVATAISAGTYLGVNHPASFANDGDTNTTWASNWDMPAWLQIQFSKTYSISKVGVWWGSHKHAYTIKLSTDGINWTTVQTGTSGNSEGANPVHEEFSITKCSAKYLKIEITSTSAPSGHIFQSCVTELEAFTD